MTLCSGQEYRVNGESLMVYALRGLTLVFIASGLGDSAMTITCRVCDTVNPNYRTKCSECNAGLILKRARSAPSTNKKQDSKHPKGGICKQEKEIFPNKNMAGAAAKGLFRKRGRMSKIYYCHSCKGYHLTKHWSK